MTVQCSKCGNSINGRKLLRVPPVCFECKKELNRVRSKKYQDFILKEKSAKISSAKGGVSSDNTLPDLPQKRKASGIGLDAD